MIFPLGDMPNPRGVPFVTYAILAVNVAVFLLVTLPLSARPPDRYDPALLEYVRVLVERMPHRVSAREIVGQVSAYDVFVFRHGFRPAQPHVASLFESLFLHAGLLHLAGNMLFLWIYGDNVEHRLGRLRYLLAYLGAGVGATLFHAAFDARSPLPLIGASGAISGLLGFYFLWFPRNQVRLLFFFFPFFVNVVAVPARILIGCYLVFDNLLPFLFTHGGGGGVAYGAHLGGFLAGLGVAALIDRREMMQTPSAFEPEPGDTGAAPAVLREAIRDGHFVEAARLYAALDADETRRILAPADSLALADWLARHGHARAALILYRRHLRDYPNGPDAAAAHLGAAVVQFEAFNQATVAYQHLLDAMELNPSPETAARVRATLDAIAARRRPPAPAPGASGWWRGH